jgi:predicted  nucleic acid-binding Zn-ribbon protein
MLNNEDINKLTSVLASKSDIQEIKSEMADLRELVQSLIVSTDGIAKAIVNLSVEYAAISTQLSRHELWIKQIAEKVGLKLATD